MAISRAQKERILSDVGQKFKKSTAVVFIRNNGVDVKSFTKLKRELTKNEVEMKVAKKTLMRLALKEINIEDVPGDVMEGPIIAAISYKDQVVGAKMLKAFMKDNEKLAFMGGILDGTVYDKKSIVALANLPAKEELLAKLVGSMKAPLSGLHYALSYNLRGLVQMLSALQKKKEQAA